MAMMNVSLTCFRLVSCAIAAATRKLKTNLIKVLADIVVELEDGLLVGASQMPAVYVLVLPQRKG